MPYNDQQYPNSGAMFDNDGGERGPAYTGNFNIDAEVLDYIVQNARSGSVTLRIAGWPRQGMTKNRIALKISIPQQQREPTYQQPQQQGGYRQQQQPQYRNQSNRPAPPQQQGYDYGQSAQRPNTYAQASRGERQQQPVRQRPAQQQEYYQPPQSRPGTPENQRFRDELDDDLPPF